MYSEKTLKKIGILGSLYISQCTPIFFMYQALPIFFHREGSSLEQIGLISLLAIPWVFKFLWAPIIDRYYLTAWGHYKSWIVIMQSFLIFTLLVCAFLDLISNFSILLVGLFFVSLFASTQDIATDGIACLILDKSERGIGNGIKIAAYFLAAIIGGVGLLELLDFWGWQKSLLIMAGNQLLLLMPILLYEELVEKDEATLMPLVGFLHNPFIRGWILPPFLLAIGYGLIQEMYRPLWAKIDLFPYNMSLIRTIIVVAPILVGVFFAVLIQEVANRRRSLIFVTTILEINIVTYFIAIFELTSESTLSWIVIYSDFFFRLVLTILILILLDDRKKPYKQKKVNTQKKVQFKTDWMIFVKFYRRPEMAQWLLIQFFYLTAITIVISLLHSLLLDIGFSSIEIDILTNIVGLLFGFIGAVVGGLIIQKFGHKFGHKFAIKRSLLLVTLLQGLIITTCLLPSLGFYNRLIIYLISILLGFISGLGYTVLSTIMMDNASTKTPATDYSLQVGIMYINILGINSISDFLGDKFGYVGLFITSIFICLITAVIIEKAWRKHTSFLQKII
jgi:MFS transporter, PAT family, beta-lactamase induction signal transducer AmpG